jgi:hypothetical protein
MRLCTPHATRPQKKILFNGCGVVYLAVGGALGSLCVIVRRLPQKNTLQAGRGWPFAFVKWSVIVETSAASDKKIRSKRAGWFIPFKGRNKYIAPK